MTKEIIQSYLYEVGAKFIVLDSVKDGTFGPGTAGFVSHVKGLDDSYQNVAKVASIIVRRGKGGKPRLEATSMYQPVFIFDDDNFKKILPADGSRKYYVHIERAAEAVLDIRKADPLDFLGWAASMAMRLRRMSESCRHKRWPEDKGHPVNRMNWVRDHFGEDPDKFLAEYGNNKDFRVEFVDAFRVMNSAMARIHLEFDLKKIGVEVNASEFLMFTNKGDFIPKDAEDKTNEYRFTEDTALLSRSFKYYTAIQDEIKQLYEDKQKKKKNTKKKTSKKSDSPF